MAERLKCRCTACTAGDGSKERARKRAVVRHVENNQNAEARRLKAELCLVTEERDILNKSAAYFAKGIKVKFAFIKQHADEFGLAAVCRVRRVVRALPMHTTHGFTNRTVFARATINARLALSSTVGWTPDRSTAIV